MLSRILKYKQDIIKYQIEYVDTKKNPHIKILPTGETLVTASSDTKIQELDNFVKSKMSWIKTKQKSIQETIAKKKFKDYKEDELFYYLGDLYILKFHPDDGSGERVIAQPDDATLTVYIKNVNDKLRIKELIDYWFSKKAEIFLKQEAKELFLKYREEFEFINELDIKVKKMNILWSDSKYIKTETNDVKNKYEIILNSRLIHAPQRIINYVIIKEFVRCIFPMHTKESDEFLEKIIPNCKELQEELDMNKNKYK